MHSIFNAIIKCNRLCFTWGNCKQFALTIQKMRVETTVFYPKISQRSFHVLHRFCIQYVAMHSKINIKEFQAAFITGCISVNNCILLRVTIYSFRFNPTECSLKRNYFIRRYRSDPAMYSTLPTPNM